MRIELENTLELARTLPAAELPRLLGDLEEIRATALARITTPAAATPPDELLNVRQAAARLGVSVAYLYRGHRRMPFARRIGRALRFSAAGLDSYLKKSR